MAYQVLIEHEHLFSRSKGRARKKCTLEATGLGNRMTAREAAEEATAYDANSLNQYTAIQEGTAEAFVSTFDADGKASDGLDKHGVLAPQGRGRKAVRPSQSDRGLGESLDKRAAFARRARSRGAAPSQLLQWSSE